MFYKLFSVSCHWQVLSKNTQPYIPEFSTSVKEEENKYVNAS